MHTEFWRGNSLEDVQLKVLAGNGRITLKWSEDI
jgi:hypothetical protein